MTGLVSGLAPHIESLLAVKHALGLPYTTSERHLRHFVSGHVIPPVEGVVRHVIPPLAVT
jgi:hypothetical protein